MAHAPGSGRGGHLPNDLYEKVYAKAMEYLAAGVNQVWLVSPEHHTVTIYRSATNITAFAGAVNW